MAKVRHLLIDTDTGVDDALALLYALHSPGVKVEAITTVAGNVEVEKCTRNVHAVLKHSGTRDRPKVAQGAKKPLVLGLVTAPEVHGRDGFGNTHPPRVKLKSAQTESAVECIRRCCEQWQDQLTIVAIGPLTNVALAAKRYPESLRKAGRFVTMGGAFAVPGNTGPVAEFNYYVDPHAANIVLHSGLPVTVVPLDLTEQIVLHRTQLIRSSRLHHNASMTFVLRLTAGYMRYHRETLGFEGGYLHDPMAMAIAIDGTLAQYSKALIDVKSGNGYARGMSDAVFGPQADKQRTKIAVRIDRTRFLRLFESRVLAV